MSYQVHNFQPGAVLLASQLNEMDNQIASNIDSSNIANEFSASSTYEVGDYVIYEGQLYQCITAITTAGLWNSSNWKQTVLGNDVHDLKSATNLSAYYINKLQDVDENLYNIEDVEWEQGGFNSTGNTTSDVWIRTGLLLGGFMYRNKGGVNRITVARYIDDTGKIDANNYMYTDNTDEWVYVPYETGYHVRFRQRKATNNSPITPSENVVFIYRPISFIVRQEELDTMQAIHTQEMDNGMTIVNGHYINYINGNIAGNNTIFYYAECKVAPGMIVYYNSVKTGTLDSRGLAFYDENGDFLSGYQMLATPQRIVVPDKAHLIKASCFKGDGSTALIFSGYNNAIEYANERIEKIEGNKYGYFRNYTDITYSLQWQHKTYDDNGTLTDSDYNIMAEIPNTGNVEVKMNRPDVKFRVYVSNQSNSSSATMLQDWSHYFYRYTPDASGHLHYYVVVALENGGVTTSGAFTAGRRGIKVYTYEDCGVKTDCPASLYGKRVAVIGDSIVQGRVRKNQADSTNTVLSNPWPYIIAEKCGTEPANYGIGGATVYGDEWLSLYTNRNVVIGYDVVFVCAGTNDFGQEVSETNFKTAYSTVITTLVNNNTKVIALTPTARQTNNQNADGKYLSDYAQYIKDVCTPLNVSVIDLLSFTENDAVFKANMPDGIHPNDIGQRIIAELVLNNIPA